MMWKKIYYNKKFISYEDLLICVQNTIEKAKDKEEVGSILMLFLCSVLLLSY